jgi:hypothetical protein
VPGLDDQIDDLYKLPLDQFTAARNALAKTVRGADATRVRTLAKPTAVAWAANQLYWRSRETYDRLVNAGEALRKAQIAALKGKTNDVRAASDAHRRAIGDAVHQAQKLAASSGSHPSADALMRMFEALSIAAEPPSPPGRLTEALQPAGFEALAGVTPVAGAFQSREHGGSEKAAPHQRASPHAAARPVQGRDEKADRERARAEATAARERERLEKQRQAEIARAKAALERAQSAEALARETLVRAERDARAAADRLARLQSER